MPDCEHSRRLSAYHDGELLPEECRDLEEHIRHCPPCARDLERLRSLSMVFGSAEMPGMSPDAFERLHSSVGSIREGLTVRMAGVLTAAAAAVLLVCSVWLWQARVTQESYVGGGPAWEGAAVRPQLAVSPSADGEMQLAQWIIEDLSRENGHD